MLNHYQHEFEIINLNLILPPAGLCHRNVKAKKLKSKQESMRSNNCNNSITTSTCKPLSRSELAGPSSDKLPFLQIKSKSNMLRIQVKEREKEKEMKKKLCAKIHNKTVNILIKLFRTTKNKHHKFQNFAVFFTVLVAQTVW